MFSLDRLRLTCGLLILPLLAFTAGAPAAANPRKPPPRPAIRIYRVHPNLANGQTYTIADLGAPPAALSLGSPVAFNNSGQVAGTGFPTNGLRNYDCVVYTGTTFVDLSSGSPDPECDVAGISSADAKGVVRIVGTVNTPFAYEAVGLLTALNAASGSLAVTKYVRNVYSYLLGVNLSGEAVGASYYNPLGGFSSSAFVVPSGTTNLDLAQPQCQAAAQYCMYLNAPLYGCPFGGCAINDAGTILGYDGATGAPMTYTYGASTSGKDLPISGGADVQFWQLNNANQIITEVTNATTNFEASSIYSITTGQTTTIPALSECSGNSVIPMSLSNAGQALGYDGPCDFYWTWDPINGVQNLNNEIPASSIYSSLTPVGVNDNGQILVTLSLVSGSTHWGILNPPTTPAARLRRRHAIFAAPVHR